MRRPCGRRDSGRGSPPSRRLVEPGSGAINSSHALHRSVFFLSDTASSPTDRRSVEDEAHARGCREQRVEHCSEAMISLECAVARRVFPSCRDPEKPTPCKVRTMNEGEEKKRERRSDSDASRALLSCILAAVQVPRRIPV